MVKARETRRGEAWVAGKGRKLYIRGSIWRMLSTSNCKERSKILSEVEISRVPTERNVKGSPGARLGHGGTTCKQGYHWRALELRLCCCLL